jgi:hypothetical protein
MTRETARALNGVEHELRELRRQWAHTEAGRRDLGPEIMPELIALSNGSKSLPTNCMPRPTTTSGRCWPPRPALTAASRASPDELDK